MTRFCTLVTATGVPPTLEAAVEETELLLYLLESGMSLERLRTARAGVLQPRPAAANSRVPRVRAGSPRYLTVRDSALPHRVRFCVTSPCTTPVTASGATPVTSLCATHVTVLCMTPRYLTVLYSRYLTVRDSALPHRARLHGTSVCVTLCYQTVHDSCCCTMFDSRYLTLRDSALSHCV